MLAAFFEQFTAFTGAVEEIEEQVRVRVVLTPMGPKIRRMQAYHSSVLVGNVEHSFSVEGISVNKGLQSHESYRRREEMFSIDMGVVARSRGRTLKTTMEPFFKKGSYDLLRKNCNSFSDAAVFFLTGKRLDPQYRGMETVWCAADKAVGIVRALTGGKYWPNQAADGFLVTKVIEQVGPQAQAVPAVRQPRRRPSKELEQRQQRRRLREAEELRFKAF
jgi:hypothetical protein